MKDVTFGGLQNEIAFIWYLETNGVKRVSVSQICDNELFGVELCNWWHDFEHLSKVCAFMLGKICTDAYQEDEYVVDVAGGGTTQVTHSEG